MEGMVMVTLMMMLSKMVFLHLTICMIMSKSSRWTDEGHRRGGESVSPTRSWVSVQVRDVLRAVCVSLSFPKYPEALRSGPCLP
jgi:hypothetical protein